MFRILSIAAALFALWGCGEREQRAREAEFITAEQFSADNVLIYYGHTMATYGPMALSLGMLNPATGQNEFTGGAFSSPQPVGPKVVFIFKAVDAGQKAAFAEEGVKIENNVAYLLPEHATVSFDVFKEATALGRIDPALGDEEIAQLFMGAVNNGAVPEQKSKPEIDVSEDDYSDDDREKIEGWKLRLRLANERLAAMSREDPGYNQALEEVAMLESILDAAVSNAQFNARKNIEDQSGQ